MHVVLGHNLYDSDAILKKNKGKRPTSYASFQKTLDILPKPAQPIPAPSSIPSPGTKELRGWSRENHSVAEWQKTDVNKVSRTPGTTEADQSYVSFAGPNSDFGVPTMEELGMIATGTVRGGEKRGLKVFEDFMKDKTRVSTFEKPKTSPAAFEPASSEYNHTLSSIPVLTSEYSDDVVSPPQVWNALRPHLLPPRHGNQRRCQGTLNSP